MIHWEQIDEYSGRLPVFGGWIVTSQKSMWSSNGNSTAVSLHQVFISDKNHEWDLKDPFKKPNSKKAKLCLN